MHVGGPCLAASILWHLRRHALILSPLPHGLLDNQVYRCIPIYSTGLVFLYADVSSDALGLEWFCSGVSLSVIPAYTHGIVAFTKGASRDCQTLFRVRKTCYRLKDSCQGRMVALFGALCCGVIVVVAERCRCWRLGEPPDCGEGGVTWRGQAGGGVSVLFLIGV